MIFRSTALFAVAALCAMTFAADPATQPVKAYPLTTCTISGEALPTDGKVVIEQIEGREVRFCCSDCVGKFKADLEASNKKLDEQIIEAGKATYPLKTCLVSGEELGGMGEPINYVHRPTNQLVKFCCKSCVKQFTDKPAPYLAKLDAAAK